MTTDLQLAARYAIYHAPAVDSAWWRFGAGWLGRDELRDLALPQPRLAGLSPDRFAAATAGPRRYGFHATLKAPFRLRAGASEQLLLRRLAEVAGTLGAVPLGALFPLQLDGFVALVPAGRPEGLHAVASHCVLQLDDLRAPLTQAELARRGPLDAIGASLLQRYGYPHVLERFRFHLTLSGQVDDATAQVLLARAAEAVDALQHGAAGCARLDRLCLFRQDHAHAPFLRIHDEALVP
ncbi:MAG: hypothetical protein JWP65_407 [Ramlibacter sp.]|jgi:hypothetical protein|uniref:DUF1045 domain-containing protein n=1 Tax=Ramlibacter sp. TaxID=1917967 RepID=UPI002604C4E2|nr:DUF1045 domain-containing protein [Ramlibacter sp.]MDB5749986.1 hypothetical protein [Ramlibacter sp.]